MIRCAGCDKNMNPIEAAGGPVCLECCAARARAAMDHRCHCGNRRRPGEALTAGGITINGVRRGVRSWVPCRRCLGTIRQLS